MARDELSDVDRITLYSERKTCRLCGSRDLHIAVPLEPLTVLSPNVGAAASLDHVTAQVDVLQCAACGFLQLPVVINPEFQYENFRYRTNFSVGLREHFESLIDRLQTLGELHPAMFVFEVGSNDGTFLEFAQARQARVLGIDPATEIAEDASRGGVPTIAGFFSRSCAEHLCKEYGEADLVISANTIANLDDLHDIFEGLRRMMTGDALLVIETQYALDVFEKFLLDVIYHEHVSYFAVKPMDTFLKNLGFELIAADRIAPKGGSIRFLAQPRGGHRTVGRSVGNLIALETEAGLYDGRLFSRFKGQLERLRRHLHARMDEEKKKNGRCYTYGASVGCAALIQYLDLADVVDVVFDDNPLSTQLVTRDRVIPVRNGSKLSAENPCEIAVLAWRYFDNIAAKHKAFIDNGGSFYPVLSEFPEEQA